MVSIQNPSVTIKDIWEYSNRSLSNPEDLANLNASAVLNAIVPTSPPENTVASRLRNGIVNDVTGNKDKYTTRIYFLQQHVNAYNFDMSSCPFQWNRGNGQPFMAFDYTSLINGGYDSQDIDARAKYRFSGNLTVKNTGGSPMGSTGSTGSYGSPETNIGTVTYNWMNVEITAVRYDGNTAYTDVNIKNADLYELYHRTDLFKSVPARGQFGTVYIYDPQDKTPNVLKERMKIETNLAEILNVTGDYYTNFMITLYQQAPKELTFRLVSGGLDVTTLSIPAGSYEGHALVDNNAATVPGETTAQIICDTIINDGELNPEIRRIEVSTLIPNTPTPTT